MYRLSIVIVLLAVISCGSPEKQQPEPIVFIGSVDLDSDSDESIYVRSYYGGETAELVDGKFNYTLISDRPQMIEIYIKRDRFHVFGVPGDSIRFDISTGKELSASAHSEVNGILKAIADGFKIERTIYEMEESEYVTLIDSIKSESLGLIESAVSNQELPEPVSRWLSSHVTFESNSLLSSYESAHKYYAKDSLYTPSAELITRIEEDRLIDPQLLNIPAYRQVLQVMVWDEVDRRIKADSSLLKRPSPYITLRREVSQDMFEDVEIRNYLMYSSLSSQYSYAGTTGTEEMYQEFLASTAPDDLKKKVSEKYEEWAHLATGLPAPGFNYPDIDSTYVSLASLRGKVVYIDVWATWCGPCIAEEPYLAELHDEFEENDKVAITSISIDQDTDAWRKMVVEKDLGGLQLLAEAAWESKIAKDYKIRGIPRFMLIDQEGRIVSVSADRPSSGNVAGQIYDLLGMSTESLTR